MKKPRARKLPPWDNPKLSQEKRTAAWIAHREKMEQSLLQKIEAWARVFDDCPLAGCRRNERCCLHRGQCRVPKKPMSPEEEEALWEDFRRQLREALAARRGEPSNPELSPQVRAWIESSDSSDDTPARPVGPRAETP